MSQAELDEAVLRHAEGNVIQAALAVSDYRDSLQGYIAHPEEPCSRRNAEAAGCALGQLEDAVRAYRAIICTERQPA